MKIKMVSINGVPTRVLAVKEDDPTFPCENCGKPAYDHPLLAKEDKDWCLNCNDDEFRSNLSIHETNQWVFKQLAAGKAVIVVRE